MKQLVLILGMLIFAQVAVAQNEGILGDWYIADFSITMSSLDDDGKIDSSWVNHHSDKEKLKEDGSVWELDFKKNGEVIQVSNMRTGEIESWGGTYELDENELRLNLEVEERVAALVYSFEIKDSILILKRSNPKGTMLIRTEFKNKE